MNVFVFKTYLEYVSPNDKVTVMRHILKELSDFAEHNILYQFTYDDLAPEQKEIIGMSEDPIAKRVANRLPARTVEQIRELTKITLYQFKMALLAAGVTMTSVDTVISNIVNANSKAEAQIYWNCTSVVKRGHP